MKPPDGQSDQFVDRFPQAGLFLDRWLVTSALFADPVGDLRTSHDLLGALDHSRSGHTRQRRYLRPSAMADHLRDSPRAQATLPLIQMRQNRSQTLFQRLIGDVHTPELHRVSNLMADPR